MMLVGQANLIKYYPLLGPLIWVYSIQQALQEYNRAPSSYNQAPPNRIKIYLVNSLNKRCTFHVCTGIKQDYNQLFIYYQA